VVDWKKYNKALVRRGEVILGFDVIDNWNNELEKMNDGKEGASYVYPHSFVQLLGYMRVYFHLPYRQTEGVVKAHATNKIPSIPYYSTINRRVNKLDVKICDNISTNDYFVIAIDSTGIKVSNRGQWIRDKWNIRKGYLKIHLAVDIKKKKVLSIKVTNEKVHDGNQLKHLVDDVIIKNNRIVEIALTDGSYDSNKNFRYLSFNGITPAIKVRKNAICRKTNHYLRNLSVIAQNNDFDKWKDSVSFGKRWIAETVFSCIKRRFGEYVSAIKFENMIKEIMIKISLYNWFITMV
jgi:transposase